MNAPYNIPEKINAFNVYKDGNKMIGVSDEITLPDLETLTETISGAGVLGEFDSPSIGLFGDMEMEIPFRQLYQGIGDLMNPMNGVDITLRGSSQVMNSSGNISFEGIRIIVRGRFKTMTGGKFKQGSGTGSSVKLGLTYYKVEIGGKNIVELDKLNCVFKIGETDIMQKVRSLI